MGGQIKISSICNPLYIGAIEILKPDSKKCLRGTREFGTYFLVVDHPYIYKKKTQILIAHQKEGVDGTKKSTASCQRNV